MKRGYIIGSIVLVLLLAIAFLFLKIDKGDDSRFGEYSPNVELQESEPLIVNLPSMAYIDSLIKAEYGAKAIGAIVIESSSEGPWVKVDTFLDNVNSAIQLHDFILPYTSALDAVIMAKRVTFKHFAGVPYYRVDNGFEAENVNGSDMRALPFVLTNELLERYIHIEYGADAQYRTERIGAVVSVDGECADGEFSFLINSLTFEILKR